MARPMLESPYEPVSDTSYFDCHENVIEKMKALGEAMTGMSKHAKDRELDNFCDSVSAFASAVCGLAENAAQVDFSFFSVDFQYQSVLAFNLK